MPGFSQEVVPPEQATGQRPCRVPRRHTGVVGAWGREGQPQPRHVDLSLGTRKSSRPRSCDPSACCPGCAAPRAGLSPVLRRLAIIAPGCAVVWGPWLGARGALVQGQKAQCALSHGDVSASFGCAIGCGSGTAGSGPGAWGAQARPPRAPTPLLQLATRALQPKRRVPAPQPQPPVPSREPGEVPASVEAWASYFCPEEVAAMFKQDRSDFTVNASSIQRPVSRLRGPTVPGAAARCPLRSRSPGHHWSWHCPELLVCQAVPLSPTGAGRGTCLGFVISSLGVWVDFWVGLVGLDLLSFGKVSNHRSHEWNSFGALPHSCSLHGLGGLCFSGVFPSNTNFKNCGTMLFLMPPYEFLVCVGGSAEISASLPPLS